MRLALPVLIAASSILLTAPPRAEACTCYYPPPQMLLFPENRAGPIPLNARIVLSYVGLRRNDNPAIAGLVELRKGNGTVVPTDVDQVLERGNENLRVIVTPLEQLEPATRYQLYGLPIDESCSSYSDRCFEEAFDKLGEWRTSEELDVNGPTFMEGEPEYSSGIAGECSGPGCTCDFDYRVARASLSWPEARDPEGEVAYEQIQDGRELPALVGGSAVGTRVLCFGSACEAGISTTKATGRSYGIVAVDWAGNRTPHPSEAVLLAPSCSSSSAGGDETSGCSSSGAPGRTEGAVFLLLLACHRWRRAGDRP